MRKSIDQAAVDDYGRGAAECLEAKRMYEAAGNPTLAAAWGEALDANLDSILGETS